MKILFDMDSLIYTAIYKILSFSEIKEMIKQGKTRQQIEDKIILESNERLANMCLNILGLIEDSGIEYRDMNDVEYYITSNIFSHRKKLDPTYKGQRKPNKWANKLRDYLIENENVKYSLEWESDDLIYERAKELNYNCVVCTVDKDLNQIKGWKFDLYKEKTGSFNDLGQEIKQYRGLKYITEEEANTLFWQQMLEGDTVDNIKGIKGIGKIKAKKQIEATTSPFLSVARTYYHYFGEDWRERFKINYRLLKLGIEI